MTEVFRKQSSTEGYVAWEAAGLRWLAGATGSGGAPVVEVLDVGPEHLDLVRLRSVAPTSDAARALGAGLAHTHDAGAPSYACAPEGYLGPGFFGPLSDPLPLELGAWDRWGEMYAEARVRPMARLARDRGMDVQVLDAVCDRLRSGDLDTDDVPARLHGDLWSGNVMWTPDGAVLVDPAAHGGHRETDLALLALFGAPHLEEVRAGYEEVHPLAEGWADRVPLHQLHCLLVHAVLFGGGYGRQALEAARRFA
ncbi:fructosamine kinase family protein [Nocardioides marmoribigeumensis]|uniref:Fructosamine-3-kinase n=1 Tax=Nocardioides marmoribigeumensis TaxID=433649 RepID=A0ABU2BXD9_9ACTN|nr:fructosamine kinase family protein [Nocardioides marmoribigeumensis]MDR7363054.1 fructosamine-3-kinase [Nocardioides marmoribigeumensis]